MEQSFACNEPECDTVNSIIAKKLIAWLGRFMVWLNIIYTNVHQKLWFRSHCNKLKLRPLILFSPQLIWMWKSFSSICHKVTNIDNLSIYPFFQNSKLRGFDFVHSSIEVKTPVQIVFNTPVQIVFTLFNNILITECNQFHDVFESYSND